MLHDGRALMMIVTVTVGAFFALSVARAQQGPMWPGGPEVVEPHWPDEAELGFLKAHLERPVDWRGVDWNQFEIGPVSLFELFRLASKAMVEDDVVLLERELESPSGCAFADGSGGVPRLEGGGELMGATVLTNPAPNLYSKVANSETQPAMVVVIDEFDFGWLEPSPGSLLQLGRPTASANAWSDWLVGNPKKRFDPATVPHGHFVVYHLLEMLSHSGATAEVEMLGSGFADVVVGDVTIRLADIDFHDLGTVSAALASSLIAGQEATLNLSWNIMDCGILADIDQEIAKVGEPVHSVVHYFMRVSDYLFDALEGITGGTQALERVCSGLEIAAADCRVKLAVVALVAMSEAVSALDEVATVSQLLTTMPGTVVAAAGNSGRSFAMPPASWEMVMGVGACELGAAGAIMPDKAPFSNAASLSKNAPTEVFPYMAPGAWFSFHPAAVADGRAYWGTSFAAPHVALLAAVGDWTSIAGACTAEPAP